MSNRYETVPTEALVKAMRNVRNTRRRNQIRRALAARGVKR